MIKLISVQKFKEGSRIEMLCGDRALAYINGILEQNHQISVALSAKPMKTAASVERLKVEKAELEYRLNGLEQAAFQQRAEAPGGGRRCGALRAAYGAGQRAQAGGGGDGDLRRPVCGLCR